MLYYIYTLYILFTLGGEMKENFDAWIKGILNGLKVAEDVIPTITEIIYLIIIVILSFVLYFIFKLIILFILKKLILRTKNKWDDAILKSKSIERALKIIPGVITYSLLYVMPNISSFLELILIIYISLMSFYALSAFLDAINDVYSNDFAGSKRKPIKGFMTVVKIIFFFAAMIIILSRLMGQSPIYVLSGLGAVSAITMLIFKDSILGMVAGIQMSTNDLVRIGDWIEMPKYGADGDVIDISLTFVKVRNWDKTITTIPAYALVSDSFKNWRGMVTSGGRRIKRSINIDSTTVKFCSEKMLKDLSKIEFLKEYLKSRQQEIQQYNKDKNIDTSIPVNGRRLTNIGVFRRYITEYLKNHPKIHKDMIIMVRQLDSGKDGIPLEIYSFTNDTQWVNYEEVMSDIFDHLFAVISYFDLKVFQQPSGSDIRYLKAE